MSGIKSRLLEYYENNEIKIDIGFFLAGYVFDAFMVTEVYLKEDGKWKMSSLTFSTLLRPVKMSSGNNQQQH